MSKIHKCPCPDSPTKGMTQGQLYHSAEGLGLGKKHTKVQPCSIKVTQVMTSKKNADVKVNVNLNVNSKRLLDSCYEHDICLYG